MVRHSNESVVDLAMTNEQTTKCVAESGYATNTQEHTPRSPRICGIGAAWKACGGLALTDRPDLSRVATAPCVAPQKRNCYGCGLVGRSMVARCAKHSRGRRRDEAIMWVVRCSLGFLTACARAAKDPTPTWEAPGDAASRSDSGTGRAAGRPHAKMGRPVIVGRLARVREGDPVRRLCDQMSDIPSCPLQATLGCPRGSGK